MSLNHKHIIHSQHEWLGDSHVQWSSVDETTRSHSFLVSNVGDCLFLKLCGFVQAENAQIDEVAENHLRLALGGSRLRSMFFEESSPLELDIQICPAIPSQTPQAEIHVTIHDRRWRPETSLFEAAARRVLCQLQSHLMVNY